MMGGAVEPMNQPLIAQTDASRGAPLSCWHRRAYDWHLQLRAGCANSAPDGRALFFSEEGRRWEH
jgi:hypothetical protein